MNCAANLAFRRIKYEVDYAIRCIIMLVIKAYFNRPVFVVVFKDQFQRNPVMVDCTIVVLYSVQMELW